MKKLLKICLVVLFIGSAILAVLMWIKHEPLPKGDSSVEADILANKMLNALNYEAYNSTQFIEWSYRNGANHYKWDKKNGIVEVSWDDYLVSLDLTNPGNSKAVKPGNSLTQKEEGKAVVKALKMFNNDSFWLVAPYKVFDKGTSRSIVPLDDGSDGLLVSYSQGGTTPGDHYLWLLNPNGFPNAFKMWVNIIPVGGIEATWDDWKVMESGAFLPQSHELGPLTLDMGSIKGYN